MPHYFFHMLQSNCKVCVMVGYYICPQEKWLCAMTVLSLSVDCVGLARSEGKRCFPWSWAASLGPNWVQPLLHHSPAESHHPHRGGQHMGPHHCHHPLSQHIHLQKDVKMDIYGDCYFCSTAPELSRTDIKSVLTDTNVSQSKYYAWQGKQKLPVSGRPLPLEMTKPKGPFGGLMSSRRSVPSGKAWVTRLTGRTILETSTSSLRCLWSSSWGLSGLWKKTFRVLFKYNTRYLCDETKHTGFISAMAFHTVAIFLSLFFTFATYLGARP